VRKSWKWPSRGLLGTALVMLLIGSGSPAAFAAPPSNDDFDGAVVVGSVPFDTYLDTREATAAPDDPANCYNSGSVWFDFTPPSDTYVDVQTYGSGYYAILSVYTGARGDLSSVPGTCGNNQTIFQASAGTTYHIMVGQCCSNGGTGGGDLSFSLRTRQAPPNDNFADAAVVSELPFNDTVDSFVASREPAEPTPSCNYYPTGTVWYAFTPAQTASVTARVMFTSVTTAVYTGSSLANLSELGCRYYGGLTFRATAGQTYFIQVGGSGNPQPLEFRLDIAVAPQVSFSINPPEPSMFDSVYFSNYSYDPADAGFASFAWAFGDGTTSTDPYPAPHRYAADGDYTAELTATTTDGRVGSLSRVVQVRTHDVAITKFTVPESARAGQTRTITVELKNNRYPETVTVELFKSSVSDFQNFERVGSLTQFVPIRPSNRTTSFTFNYTFTGADLAVGKVTFKAVASIVDARDAISADNVAIALPTRVT